MSDLWVVNASPVILLAKAGHLKVLERLAPDLCMPQAVVEEILAGPDSDPARQAVHAGWPRRLVPVPPEAAILEWKLGAGESAVLQAARQNPGSTAVLDDALARDAARTFRIPVIGTLGIVLRAKRSGLIESAADMLQELRAAGLFLSPVLLRQPLLLVGEEPRENG